MVGKEQLKRGAMKFVSRELVPLMGVGKGIVFEAFAPDIIEAKLNKYMAEEWLGGTSLVEGATVNLDEIYRKLKLAAATKWPIELFDFKFTEADLDKLYNYVKEAG